MLNVGLFVEAYNGWIKNRDLAACDCGLPLFHGVTISRTIILTNVFLTTMTAETLIWLKSYLSNYKYAAMYMFSTRGHLEQFFDIDRDIIDDNNPDYDMMNYLGRFRQSFAPNPNDYVMRLLAQRALRILDIEPISVRLIGNKRPVGASLMHGYDDIFDR